MSTPAHLAPQLAELTRLRAAPWNPKTIGRDRLLNLCRSIAADPELLWTRPALSMANGDVYAGCQRRSAVAYLWQYGTPPNPDAPGAEPIDWEKAADGAGIAPGTIPAVIEDVPLWLAKERGTKDNGQWGDYEPDALAALIAELREQGRDIGVLGFDEAALKALLDVLPPAQGGTGYDPGPGEVPAVPQSRTGDLWLLGEAHRLIVGDCTDPGLIGLLMGDHRAAVLMTDPPYGIDYADLVSERANQKRGGWKAIKGDEATGEALLAMLRQAWLVARSHAVREDAAWYCWHPPLANRWVFRQSWEAAGVAIHKEIVWAKPRFGGFSRVEYHYQHEPCQYGWAEGKRPKFLGPRTETTLWQVDYEAGGINKDIAVSTQKPPALWRRAIENHTARGQVIFDGFAGSGPAVIAAEQSGRRAFVCEKDPATADVIVDRWCRMTGQDAVRQDGIKWSELHQEPAEQLALVGVGHNLD